LSRERNDRTSAKLDHASVRMAAGKRLGRNPGRTQWLRRSGLARRLSDPRNAAGGTGLERAHVSALARAVL